jgi:hypothetical protein
MPEQLRKLLLKSPYEPTNVTSNDRLEVDLAQALVMSLVSPTDLWDGITKLDKAAGCDRKQLSHYGACPTRVGVFTNIYVEDLLEGQRQGHSAPASAGKAKKASMRWPPVLSWYQDLGNNMYATALLLLVKTQEFLTDAKVTMDCLKWLSNETKFEERCGDLCESYLGGVIKRQLEATGQDNSFWERALWDVSFSPHLPTAGAARLFMVFFTLDDVNNADEMPCTYATERTEELWPRLLPHIKSIKSWLDKTDPPRGGRKRSMAGWLKNAARDQQRKASGWSKDSGWSKATGWSKASGWSKDSGWDDTKDGGWSKASDDPQGPTAPASAGEGNDSEADRQDPPTTFQQRKEAARKRLLSPSPPRDDEKPEDPGDVPDWDPAWDADL